MESALPAEAAKYQKLASEYAKLRAQASVLKKAVLEEQTKNANLREQLRQKESTIRRAEQEVDSLGFRNNQLEHRVGALQEEIAINEKRKREKEHKRSAKVDAQQQQQQQQYHNQQQQLQHQKIGDGITTKMQDELIFEELQKKIMENAQLTSLIEDKKRELELHVERIMNLEKTVDCRATEYNDLEKRLRRELETLQIRNSELETKLVEAASMLGSEDALSVSGSDHTPLQALQNHTTLTGCAASCSSGQQPQQQQQQQQQTYEERIALLEKEVTHWRTHYEIIKMSENFANSTTITNPGVDISCTCSTTAASLNVKPTFPESKSAQRARDSLKEISTPPTKEQLMFDHFCNKYEELLKAKSIAESRITSYEIEAEHLQNCLDNATQELKAKDEDMQSINEALRLLEDDLTTTRANYEEQISVLTEQVINLSEQLAASK